MLSSSSMAPGARAPSMHPTVVRSPRRSSTASRLSSRRTATRRTQIRPSHSRRIAGSRDPSKIRASAALNPTSMNGTWCRLRASRTARSPSVKTEKSSMCERSLQAGSRRFLQISQDPIDAAHVQVGTVANDPVRLRPSRFVRNEPGALFRWEYVRLRHRRDRTIRKCSPLLPGEDPNGGSLARADLNLLQSRAQEGEHRQILRARPAPGPEFRSGLNARAGSVGGRSVAANRYRLHRPSRGLSGLEAGPPSS